MKYQLMESGRKQELVMINKKELGIYISTIIICVFLTKVVFMINYVPSGSMYPTIHRQELLLSSRVSTHKINRYDIVVFQYPDDPSELFIKRVIGMPGDKIEIENGSVYANGKKLRDDFVKNKSYDSGTYVVPKNSYFMMGDNRPNSIDSRFWNNHFVKKDAIKAKAFLRLKFLPEVLK